MQTVKVSEVPVEDLCIGDKVISIRGIPGKISDLDLKYKSYNGAGWMEIKWDNGGVSCDILFDKDHIRTFDQITYIGSNENVA